MGLIEVDHEFNLMDVVYGFNKGVQLLQRLLPYHKNIVFIFLPDQWCKFMCSYGVLFRVIHVDQGVSSCTFSFQSHFGYSYIDPKLNSEGDPCQYWLKSGVLVSYSKLWVSIRPFGVVLSYSSDDPCRSVLCYVFLTPDSSLDFYRQLFLRSFPVDSVFW